MTTAHGQAAALTRVGNKIVSTTSYLVKATLYVLVLGIVVGCSAPRELNESAAAALLQRVTDRWRCLERNDVNCAYQYTSPGFRSVFSQKMYGFRDISTLKRRLTGARVVEYDAGAAGSECGSWGHVLSFQIRAFNVTGIRRCVCQGQ